MFEAMYVSLANYIRIREFATPDGQRVADMLQLLLSCTPATSDGWHPNHDEESESPSPHPASRALIQRTTKLGPRRIPATPVGVRIRANHVSRRCDRV